MPTVTLPAVVDVTGPMLTALTAALGVERAIIASDEQIGHVWSNLPRLLSRIPAEHRSETLARMCVAVAAGLLDSAINYAWNAAIVELRAKVRRFGLTVVPQVINKPFDEEAWCSTPSGHGNGLRPWIRNNGRRTAHEPLN
jgi:hypothetical protein